MTPFWVVLPFSPCPRISRPLPRTDPGLGLSLFLACYPPFGFINTPTSFCAASAARSQHPTTDTWENRQKRKISESVILRLLALDLSYSARVNSPRCMFPRTTTDAAANDPVPVPSQRARLAQPREAANKARRGLTVISD